MASNKSNKTTSSVIILGDAFADLFCFLDGDLPNETGGDTRLTQPITTVAGGSGLNTATHLKGINKTTDVCLYTAINISDTYGQLLRQHANKYDFALVNCTSSYNTNDNQNEKTDISSSTGHCAVIVANGERSFLTHLGVMETFQAKHISLDSILLKFQKSSYVHIAGYYNIPGFWGGDQLQELLKLLKQQAPSIVVSLVPQYDATERWDGQLIELLPSIDYLFVNKLEARNIVKARSDDVALTDSSNDTEFLTKIATYFHLTSPNTCIVVTLGANGACALWQGAVIAKQPAPISLDNPLDPTGAGDSFIAGFFHGILTHNNSRSTLNGKQDPEALARGLLYGSVLGTSCVMRPGASTPATESEIDSILKEHEEGNLKSRK
jgi:sugar/nucleoside kinase (ribokinase family)